MKGVANISFEGGGLVVSVQTPYDRELLFERVEASTKRHGSVRLEVDDQQWTISMHNGHRQACAACSRWLDDLTYRFDGHTLCGQCTSIFLSP